MIISKMPRSDDALLNDILNARAELLSDVGRLRGLPQGCSGRRGFTKYSKLFCDSIIFWGLYNGEKEETKGTTIGKYIAQLRDVFNQSSLEVESVKLTQCGELGVDDEYFSSGILMRHSSLCGEPYQAKYIAIKVSLDYCRAKRVVPMLANALPQLADDSIVMHDVDFARDCRYVTTRAILQRLVMENEAGTNFDDRSKVGDHCLSWRGTEHENIRYKVYNKFVQMLESADVRKSLGSRMENLVEREGKFARQLEKRKKHGYTRIELTFYGSTLLSLWKYSDRMDETTTLLEECRTFKCSFEAQWQQRAECITSMVAVHFPEKKLFAYCHWWNSITAKKYGYMWTNVSPKVVPLLLANYSFNDRPIHYLVAAVGEDDHAIVETEEVYERVHGCTAITLVAGASKGMFPSRNAIEGGARKFRSVGIVEVDNITIRWPKRVHDKRTPPLADIVERASEECDDFVQHLKSIHTSSYTADYNILESGEEYTIVAAGMKEFRRSWEWHAITECGLKVRMGKSLRQLWCKWRAQYMEGTAPTGSVDGVERMTFVAGRIVRSKGRYNIKCELVE